MCTAGLRRFAGAGGTRWGWRWRGKHLSSLSEAKTLLSCWRTKQQVLRFAQDDNSILCREFTRREVTMGWYGVAFRPLTRRCPGLRCHDRQRDREHRASARGRRGFDVPSMLAKHGLADAQAEAGPAAGTSGREEWIKDVRQGFGCDSWTVILKHDPYRVGIASDAHTNRAFLAAFADRLLGIQQ